MLHLQHIGIVGTGFPPTSYLYTMSLHGNNTHAITGWLYYLVSVYCSVFRAVDIHDMSATMQKFE